MDDYVNYGGQFASPWCQSPVMALLSGVCEDEAISFIYLVFFFNELTLPWIFPVSWIHPSKSVCISESLPDCLQVQFVPEHQNKLLSASVDGLVCIFDTAEDINDDDHLESVSTYVCLMVVKNILWNCVRLDLCGSFWGMERKSHFIFWNVLKALAAL